MRRSIRGVRLKGLFVVRKPGREYWYLRRRGLPLVRMPDLPHDHPDFLAAYADAWREVPTPRQRAPVGSVAGLIEATMRSDRFLAVSTVYRATLRRHFEAIREKAGSAPASGLRDRHVKADVHGAASPTDRLKAWRFLASFGVDTGLLKDDPTIGIRIARKKRTAGWPPWTDSEKDAYRDRWPIGSVPRAAFELLNWTGFRIGDAVKIGPGHIDRRGVLIYSQSKVKEPAFIPWTCPLPAYAAHTAHERDMMHQSIDALNRRQMTFLATQTGGPRSEKSLGNMIRESARDAGFQKSAHGLRKTRGISLAEGGASAHQIMSWLGHQTLKEAEHYTQLASRRRAVFGTEQDQNSANSPR